MTGRPRKPTQKKIIHGTFRKDRAPKNEPIPEKSEKEKAPWWMKGYVTRKAYRDLSRYLKENGLLTKLDEMALEMLVSAYAKWRDAREKAKIGIYKTSKGYVGFNPMITVEKTYFKELRDMLIEFGMTPSARSRIDVKEPEGKEEDMIEKMLNEK